MESMSSFAKKTLNPKTKKLVKALWTDDYFGSHSYGVGFRKDGKNAKVGDDLSGDDYYFYPEEEIEY